MDQELHIRLQGEPENFEEWKTKDLATLLNTRPTISFFRDLTNPKPILTMVAMMPRIICADGASLSVQANRHVASIPRADRGPYTHVEVGYPSNPPETWDEYAMIEDERDMFVAVPISLVMMYIGAHGGIDREKTFEGYDFRLGT